MQQAIADIEQKYGGRLGVAIMDTATGKLIAHRGDERFALCSTFKVLAAAFILARVDLDKEGLERRIVYTKEDLVAYSPVTEVHVGGNGLGIGDLCEAAITRSDNTAANLLLDSFGGPSALTTYIRSFGDDVTRLDRRETALNDVASGDLRDTTTPVAMLQTLQKMALGNALSAASRAQLIQWMIANKTGDARLRAGVPKTGASVTRLVQDRKTKPTMLR